MTFKVLTDLEKRIMAELARGPALSMMELINETAPPFAVRASLQKLRRERLVTDHHLARGHVWELTPTGHEYINGANQLRLV